MKSFKLIQIYPGSPPLGTIITREGNTDVYRDIYNGQKSYRQRYYMPNLIENYSKFWKEMPIKEKL